MTALGIGGISDYGDYPPEEELEYVRFAGVRKKRGQWHVGVQKGWISERPYIGFAIALCRRCKRTWYPVEAHTASDAVRAGLSLTGLMQEGQ